MIISSLRLKLFIVSCSVLLGVVTALTAFFTMSEVHALEQRLNARTRLVAELLTPASTLALAFDDVAAAREAFTPLAVDLDVLSVVLRRNDGTVVHEQLGLGKPGDVLLVRAPLTSREGPSGTLEVKASHARIAAERQGSLRASVLVALVALLAACAASWIIGTSFDRRVKAMTAHVKAIGEERAVAPLADANNDELGVLSRAFDHMTANVEERVQLRVAELVKAEDELLEALGKAAFSEEFNRAIVENAADGIVTTDPDGTISTWNAAAENIFAIQSADAIGRPLSNFLPQRGHRRGEETITRADGTVTQLDVRYTEVRVTEGTLRVAFLRDLAEEKHATYVLAELNQQLVDASRLAGMADVASGILHNVGNVLNSVNVSATLLDDTVRRSSVASVGKLAAMLKEHSNDLAAFLTTDPRGKRVPELVDLLTNKLGVERDTLLVEIAGLRKNIEHIREIVSMQQEYTKKSGVEEHIQLLDTINDAVDMSLDDKGLHQIEVVRELEALPIMLLDRHLTMQILVNLLRNARHAVRDAQRADPRITVKASSADGRVKIAIQDNGVGIDAEAFGHLFQQGFTTKSDGHGYGLHSSANAAKEMGGSLLATSDGKGLGACFVLELPIIARAEAA